MGIRQRVQNIVKYNRLVYDAYYHIASGALRLVGLLTRTDDKLVFFNSFAGRNYDDSPRAVYEAMRSDPRFRGFRVVWAFHDPDAYDVPDADKVRTDTPLYFVTALRARAWVTNSSVERGLRFKRPGTVYVNTWHGTPIKHMGTDIAAGNTSFRGKRSSKIDIFCVQGRYEADIFARGFGIDARAIARTGLPRNDELATPDEARRRDARRRLGIPDGKLAILYCPTFREYDKGVGLAVQMRPPIDLDLWRRKLGDTHVLLVRAHYEVTDAMEVPDDSFARDVSGHQSLNELIIASDLLVSDYSSVFFDYSITGKPMLHFCYDYDRYAKERGMYFDIREWLSGAGDETGLIELIRGLDAEAESARTVSFRERYVDYYGDASRQVLDLLYERLRGE